ncbi:MAG: hypothetical protein KJO49_06455 [Bacteroidia bacterium]|nr:hypothetical protein [Bacteroidia bacterium]
MKLGFQSFALLALLFLPLQGVAQSSIRPDSGPLTAKELSNLQEVFGNHLHDRILSRQNMLAEIKDVLRNRIQIVKLDNPQDQKSCSLLSDVALYSAFNPDIKRDKRFDPSSFNPLKYAFNYRINGASMYRVDQTNYYIIINPRSTE